MTATTTKAATTTAAPPLAATTWAGLTADAGARAHTHCRVAGAVRVGDRDVRGEGWLTAFRSVGARRDRSARVPDAPGRLRDHAADRTPYTISKLLAECTQRREKGLKGVTMIAEATSDNSEVCPCPLVVRALCPPRRLHRSARRALTIVRLRPCVRVGVCVRAWRRGRVVRSSSTSPSPAGRRAWAGPWSGTWMPTSTRSRRCSRSTCGGSSRVARLPAK